MRRWTSPVTDISVSANEISATGKEIFPYEHSSPVTRMHFFEKAVSLSKLGGQNGIILPCIYFHFRNVRVSFISEVKSIDKATIVVNDATLCVAILVSSLEFYPRQPG